MLKLNRILSAATAMAMAFTMYADAVNLDAVDNEPEEVLAPPEAYNMVHHLTEDKTRGTSFRTYDLAENFYQGTFAFDSTLYSNFQFIPNPADDYRCGLHIKGESKSDHDMPVKVFFLDVCMKKTLGFDVWTELELERDGNFDYFVNVGRNEKYFLHFSKAIDGVKLTGNFTVV